MRNDFYPMSTPDLPPEAWVALPPVYHFLYQGTPPLQIVGTRQYPDICEFCTHKEA